MAMSIPNRKKIRLKDYDYSQAGFYFITICTNNREKLLCLDTDATIGSMILTESGKLTETALKNIETIYSNVFVDEYVIMPNHIHFILAIENYINGGQQLITPTVSRIIKQLKGYITKNCNQDGFSWQKSYYEHIIRNKQDLYKIREYILNNPIKWHDDEYYT